MIITDSKVTHRTFGAGTVIAQEGNIVTVRFLKEFGDKRFQYPAAFKCFLTLTDPVLYAGMESELKHLRNSDMLKQMIHEAEAKKERELERDTKLKVKRTAAGKKSPAKTKKPPKII